MDRGQGGTGNSVLMARVVPLPEGTMGMLDRLKGEIKIAGNAVRETVDEGRTRIEIFRVRQSADSAAQALGYAVHRAKRDGKEIEVDTFARLDETLGKHESEAARLEAELARLRGDTPPV